MLAPYDAEDARGLLKSAIRDPDPVIFLENEILYGESFPVEDKVLDKDFTLPIGKCKVRALLYVVHEERLLRPKNRLACSLGNNMKRRLLGVLCMLKDSHKYVARQVMREGKDVTLVAFGKLVGYNLKAAAELEKEGISCEVSSISSSFKSACVNVWVALLHDDMKPGSCMLTLPDCHLAVMHRR